MELIANSAPIPSLPGHGTRWVFSGIQSVEAGENDERDLGDGFSLCRPNGDLLSARDRHLMNLLEYEEAERVSRYLLYKQSFQISSRDESDEVTQAEKTFWNALVAFQIIKPVPTLGFTLRGTTHSGAFHLETTQKRSPMSAGQWARMRLFDEALLPKVPDTIRKVQRVMGGSAAETKNALILLQLGLETNSYHQLLAGLLWVMGIEAIFDSSSRQELKKKLCSHLGSTTLVFPGWNSPEFEQPTYTVKDLAIPIYMLRNKLAHGADLRKAVLDKTTPVDLIKSVKLVDGLQDRANAYLLSEAACYLLCQVLQKII